MLNRWVWIIVVVLAIVGILYITHAGCGGNVSVAGKTASMQVG